MITIDAYARSLIEETKKPGNTVRLEFTQVPLIAS